MKADSKKSRNYGVELPYFETEKFKELRTQVCAVLSSLDYQAILREEDTISVFEGKPKTYGFWVFKDVRYLGVCTIWFMNLARGANYRKKRLGLDYGNRLEECKVIANLIASTVKMSVRLSNYDSSWDEWLDRDGRFHTLPHGAY